MTPPAPRSAPGESKGIDTAFLPAGLKLSSCKVLAMDMDSTLINIECIDEIAGVAGVKDKVSEITEAAMRGEIKDFSESLRRRVALLKGVPAERWNRSTRKSCAESGRRTADRHRQAAGIKVLLVSGGFTFFTDRLREAPEAGQRARQHAGDRQWRADGRVLGDILDADAKAVYLREFARQHDATRNRPSPWATAP